ncbi:MAG TPA: hypothetical protein VGR38_13120 [Candidatus Polarisedimenticolia bacterium]|jgi:hypothetical protein|nr:hypothetical protein [Candidatus Polarisedimenticolia bacterium]
MPIDYSIDHGRRLVLARGIGILTDEDVFRYQGEVWSRADVSGYDELMDMSKVKQVALPSVKRVRKLAQLSAGMDAGPAGSKFAIVAPSDLAFGLGRMYEMYREMEARSNKEAGVFRSLGEALAFLGVEGAVPLPPV